MAAGVMTLAACTSEDVVDESKTQSNAISFENVVNKATRAIDGDLNLKTFDQFMVYGYYLKPQMTTPIQIFNGVPVNASKDNDGNITGWSYAGTRYWVPDCSYFFYAYSCGNAELATGFGSAGMSLFDQVNTSVDSRALILQKYLCDQSHNHDLITAENETITATEKKNPQVALEFSHALCKIKAEFTTDFPDDYKVYVSNVFVTSYYRYADFNVGKGEWSNFGGKDNTNPITLNVLAEKDMNFVTNKAGSELQTSEAFIIPKIYDAVNNDNVELHFSIDVKKDGVLILQRNIHGTWSPQWNKGNIYQYSINISGSTAGIEPIVFAASQSLTGNQDWTDSGKVEMVFGVDANPNAHSNAD